MCTTCGCSNTASVQLDGLLFTPAKGKPSLRPLRAEHTHSHARPEANHPGPAGNIVQLEEDILAWNDHLAEHNRKELTTRRVLALNLLSSPGSGKTTLLSESISHLHPELHCSVVEGDQATENDARRIREAGAAALQVNTGTGCHLEADMLESAIKQLNPPEDSLLFIENVGNLVCPALFDLGEKRRVVLLSVTEGDDKPEKYPHMFRSADLILITKTDLLPYVDFDVAHCTALARELRPEVPVICLSSKTGEGMDDWYRWLEAECREMATEK